MFIKEPPNRVDFSNTTGAVIECTARGNPTPEIIWIRPDGSAVGDVPGLRQVCNSIQIFFLHYWKLKRTRFRFSYGYIGWKDSPQMAKCLRQALKQDYLNKQNNLFDLFVIARMFIVSLTCSGFSSIIRARSIR